MDAIAGDIVADMAASMAAGEKGGDEGRGDVGAVPATMEGGVDKRVGGG